MAALTCSLNFTDSISSHVRPVHRPPGTKRRALWQAGAFATHHMSTRGRRRVGRPPSYANQQHRQQLQQQQQQQFQQQQQLQQQQHMQRAAPPPVPSTLPKEEPAAKLHDEADLILFRADALARFVANHELMENVTLKFVHTSKITPPAAFPGRGGGAVAGLGPEDGCFGDVATMRARLELLEAEVAAGRAPAPPSPPGFQREATAALAQLQQGLDSASAVGALAERAAAIERQLVALGVRYELTPAFTRVRARLEVAVDRAPPGYDAREADREEERRRAEEQRQAQRQAEAQREVARAEAARREHEFRRMAQQQGAPAATAPAAAFGEDFLDVFEPRQPAPDAVAPPRDGDGGFMMMNKELDLFAEPAEELAGNAIMTDDMDNLINFQGDGGDLMDEQAFDENFLSQIDHSME
jgi:hypothetical protein